MALDLEQFRNLDFNNIGTAPPLVRGILIMLLCAAVVGAGYWFDTQHQWAALEKARANELKLKTEFESKQSKAVNLEVYQQQMKEMEESFGTMLRQLPSKTEVADLLVDVTQSGLASGLEFELFKPGQEMPRDFYAELPIQVKVVGDYHEFGQFISRVASLPRIVTLHDIYIYRNQDQRGTQKSAKSLVMEVNAKTYRYLDEEEIAAARKKSEDAARKDRKKK